MKKWVIGLSILLALVSALLIKVSWEMNQSEKLNTELNKELMKGDLELGRAYTQFGNANEHISELDKALKEEMKKRQAVLARYGIIKAKYDVLVNSEVVVTIPDPVEPIVHCDDPVFTLGTLYFAQSNTDLLPLNKLEVPYSDFRLDFNVTLFAEEVSKSKLSFKIDYHLHQRFVGHLVETITPSGAINHYFNMYELDGDNRKVDKLELEEFSVVVDDQRDTKFFPWAPHLDVVALIGLDTTMELKTGGSIGVSFMGYGLTVNDLSWRFLRISMDTLNQPGIGFSPLQYNVATLIPLLSNVWVGPHFLYSINQDKMIGFSIGAIL